MAFSSLKEIFDAFNKLKVLIIGDVMVDAYVWGEVDRISPEAPVPIVSVQKRENRLGGAANVALNLQALGASPILCSVVGDDLGSKTFEELLKKSGITTTGIIKSKNRSTTVKKRVLSGSQHILRIDYETIRYLHTDEELQLIEAAKKHIDNVDVIVFQDYDKGIINKNVIKTLISLANKNNIPTVVDPKKKNFFNYSGASLFKPNLKELQEGLNIKIDLYNLEHLTDAVKQLKEKANLSNILTTLSERGIYIDFEAERHFIPAHVRAVADVSGAGDTVVSIAALCLALKLPPRIIAALSNLGGGLVCEHLGVVPIGKKELFREALENNIFEEA